MSLKPAQISKKNLQEIKKNIQKYSPAPQKVKIIAVTKTYNYSSILSAVENKIFNIGENKIQETKQKLKNQQKPKQLKIHLLGHLQSNKVKQAVELYDTIQSVDSIKIANKINKEAEKIKKVQTIYIQINISKNPNQQGIYPKETETTIKEIKKFKNIRIKGIMAIGVHTKNKQRIVAAYKKIKKLKEKQEQVFKLRELELSLGMSDDYKYALQEGATTIRIGTKIFGKRK